MQDGFARSVAFTTEDYHKLRSTYRKWWNGELGRPIAGAVLSRPEETPGPALRFATAWDESIRPDEFIAALDRRFSSMRWLGEAYPWVNFDAFGPGVLAAFLGCRPIGRRETVWFAPPRENMPLREMHFELNEHDPRLRRVLGVYEAGMEKWRGAVVLGMADLGGILDILASFRGTENLLMDLYDEPEEVLRCVGELQREWFKCYDLINRTIGSEAMGHTQWFNLYGEEPGYILQSDFSYMISPKMFETFVAPELSSSAGRLSRALYHLDGTGELPHLDMLLEMEDVKAIQWVPGDGPAASMDWTELLGRILAGGKKLLSCALTKEGALNPVIKDPGQVYVGDRHFQTIDEAKRWAEKFGVEL
ncbi:MAG: hypothetical protein Q4A66_06990 [Eubacteriales bacterium]|nr:hypothetical protein [Eubacteriales bacterium]